MTSVLTSKCKNTFITKKKEDIIKEDILLKYSDYKNNDILKKYKINELKIIAKYNKLYITGTKPILIERIENHFKKCNLITKIQKIYRSYIVRQSFILRGEGYYNISLCVNESDFYTLEPIKDIPKEYLYTFKNGEFIYGCNIISFIYLMKNNTIIKNPYNREILSETIKNDIIKLYNFIKIIFGLPYDAPQLKTCNKNTYKLTRNSTVLHNVVLHQEIDAEIIQERMNKIREIRRHTINVRINELFMEIDQLGNYTNSSWFSNLQINEYIRLFRTLLDIWNVRGQLTTDIKRKICVIHDPFYGIINNIYIREITIDIIRDACLQVFENLVHCGIDIEHRKIGAMHALTALTVVSLNARNSLYWLYESLFLHP